MHIYSNTIHLSSCIVERHLPRVRENPHQCGPRPRRSDREGRPASCAAPALHPAPDTQYRYRSGAGAVTRPTSPTAQCSAPPSVLGCACVVVWELFLLSRLSCPPTYAVEYSGRISPAPAPPPPSRCPAGRCTPRVGRPALCNPAATG